MDNNKAYWDEREKRWQMEKVYLPLFSQNFLGFLNHKLPKANGFKYEKYADHWIKIFKEMNEHKSLNWIKGSPDIIIYSNLSKFRSAHIELKIKDKGEFRKTIYGGTTKEKTEVPKYGCTSFYLDVEPVFVNISSFCEKTGLAPEKYFFIFSKVPCELNETYIISLSQINDLIKNGWKNTPMKIFGEGYGRPSYLIPKDAMKSLNSLTEDECRFLFEPTIPIRLP